MKRIACICALVIGIGGAHASAQTVTLGGPASVASANDYATATFQDPWDMNERTDVGWWLNSEDAPANGFAVSTFSAGLFSGTVSADPNLWLLETGVPNLPAVGKNGNSYSINATTYRIVAVRMRLDEAGYMLFHWSTNTMYDAPGLTTAGVTYTNPGWGIYFVNLASLPLLNGSDGWNGSKRSLRFDPAPDNATAGSHIDIDWIRLVDDQPALFRTVSWTSFGGNVDLYLDNDTNPSETLGLLASNVGGSNYPLNAGALPAGSYRVGIRRTGTNNPLVYSGTAYQVNGPATVTVTSPSEEGSADDFATVHLGDPWDMNSLSDIDSVYTVSNIGITTIPGAETEAGTALGNITAFAGVSQPGIPNGNLCGEFAKPVVYPLDPAKRGASARIDPNKYRIFTAELGLPNKARNLCKGSIVRVGWYVAGDAQWTSSWGIPLNSRAGANVVDRINFDMAAIPIDAGGASQTGWVSGGSASPGISGFRIDPHEFVNATSFFIKRIKLAAFETANATYTVRWTASKVGDVARVYYDTDRSPDVKTLIGTTGASSLNGSLQWNTSGLPAGAYYVYVEVDDGINTNGTYAKWPVVVDHSATATARLVLSRNQLNFGIRGLNVKTPPQTVRLTVLDAPAGQPCWSATSELWFLQVTPSSGCGSATLTVALLNQDYPWTGDFVGSIRVSSSGALNSPQGIQTIVRMNPSSGPPTGAVDTPANGAVVSGSVAVTGWAVDDIGVARVTICRDQIAGEPAQANPACGAGQIYLGDAVSIEDARPDIVAYSPATPFNYRAGWGFLILTNMLPNQGTGSFVLRMRAFDVDGQTAELGWRVIDAQNAGAQEPFGAIDTPGQGETISGSNYPNFGWVLSRFYRADPPGGGSVVVYVDGVAVGSPAGWSARSDLSSFFAGYPGIDTALGVYELNTLPYANGLHTIVWVVSDNGGRVSGVGSRYFSIFNGGAAVTSSTRVTRPAGPDLGRRIDELSGITGAGAVATREGFRLGGPTRSIDAGINGVRRVWATERERLEIRLGDKGADGADEYAAYLMVNGRLTELPVGSSFDPARGAFYWQPGLGYMGDFDLMFVRTSADGARERIPVKVTLQPRPALNAAALRGPWSRVEF